MLGGRTKPLIVFSIRILFIFFPLKYARNKFENVETGESLIEIYPVTLCPESFQRLLHLCKFLVFNVFHKLMIPDSLSFFYSSNDLKEPVIEQSCKAYNQMTYCSLKRNNVIKTQKNTE